MVGNDIVDLVTAKRDSNWKRNGYLNKICSSDEQQMILQASDPDQLLWLIWTMKESAYKIVNKTTGTRSYAPLSLSCTDLVINQNRAAGAIHHAIGTIYTQTEIKEQLIHSIAVLDKTHFETTSILHLEYTSRYLENFNQSSKAYQLSKDQKGAPQIIHIASGCIHDASISHHGRYLAIVYSGSPLSAG